MTGPTGIAVDLHVRRMRLPADVEVVHQWLTTDRAKFWGMRNATRDEVERSYREIETFPHHDAFIGLHVNEPAFLVERYDPAHEEVGRHFRVRDGDVGMHFLVAPMEQRIPGFTRAVIGAVMDLVFSDPDVRRAVVEPDVSNSKVHRLNSAVGFTVDRRITLSDKTALLSFCTRQQYAAARGPHRHDIRPSRA